MVVRISCPDPNRLERFALGLSTAEEADPLEEHVSECTHCLGLLETMRGEDGLIDAVRAARLPDVIPQEELLRAILPALQRMTAGDQTLPDNAPAPTAGFGSSLFGPAQAPDELGRLGKYCVRKVLGAGGMGVVYLADDSVLHRPVALKVIKPELLLSAGARARFLREARAVARVEHENIIPIYQADEEGGMPFLAMPVLRGESLEERLTRAKGPLKLPEIVAIALGTARGLAAAHERDLVHRDIKPGNLFLTQRGDVELSQDPRPVEPAQVRILDFGLACALDPGAEEMSVPGAIVGTPAYMAPEQGSGLEVDGRADLFSLGCVLYRMSTGEQPFRGSNLMTLMMNIATVTPLAPRRCNPALPPALERLILRLLAKEPAQRPDSARLVAEELEKFRRKSLSRRAWLGITVSTALGVGATTAALVWYARPPVLTPPEPGEITFETDEDDPRIELIGGEERQTLNLAHQRKYSLLPGEYSLRSVTEKKDRRLTPATVVVRSAESQRITVRWIGEVARDDDHNQAVLGIAVHGGKQDLMVLSACSDGTVGVWRLARKGRLPVFVQKEAVRSVAITTDGKLAASAGGGKGSKPDLTIRLWSPDSLQQTGEPLAGHRSLVTALAFTPDGKRLVSGAADGGVFLWDLESRQRIPLDAHDGTGVNGVAIVPDGSWALTSGGDGQVIVWEVATGKLLHRLVGHNKPVRGVACSAGKAVSVDDAGAIYIWDLKLLKGQRLRGPEDGLQSVALSPDETRFLTGGLDGLVRLWDMASRKQMEQFNGHRGKVNAVAFTVGGRRAVSAGADQTVRLWELP